MVKERSYDDVVVDGGDSVDVVGGSGLGAEECNLLFGVEEIREFWVDLRRND